MFYSIIIIIDQFVRWSCQLNCDLIEYRPIISHPSLAKRTSAFHLVVHDQARPRDGSSIGKDQRCEHNIIPPFGSTFFLLCPFIVGENICTSLLHDRVAASWELHNIDECGAHWSMKQRVSSLSNMLTILNIAPTKLTLWRSVIAFQPIATRLNDLCFICRCKSIKSNVIEVV